MHLLLVWPVQTSRCSNPYYETKNLLDNVSSLVAQMEKEGNDLISLQRDGSLKTTDVCSPAGRNRRVSAFIWIPPSKNSSTIVLKTFWEVCQSCWRQPQLRGHVTIISWFSQLFSTLFEYKNTPFRLMSIIEFLGLIKAPGASFLIHHAVSLSSHSHQTPWVWAVVWCRGGGHVHTTAMTSSLYRYSIRWGTPPGSVLGVFGGACRLGAERSRRDVWPGAGKATEGRFGSFTAAGRRETECDPAATRASASHGLCDVRQ